MTCDELRTIAADLALDEVTGEARADALTHIATCDPCRAVVAELALVADSVLLVAPAHEPPPGFESRVLRRIGAPTSARDRARHALPVVAAALVAATLGVIGGTQVSDRRGHGARRPPIAATFLTVSSARPAGAVVLTDAPDRMTCVFSDDAFGGDYDVVVVLRDGSRKSVGTFTATKVPWSWTWTMPSSIDVGDVREVRVRSGDGVLRLTARLD